MKIIIFYYKIICKFESKFIKVISSEKISSYYGTAVHTATNGTPVGG